MSHNISVTIPTLNEEDSLPSCLDNLMPQLGEDDECIIIDGGSDDRTQEVAERYGCNVLEAEGSSIGMARHVGAKFSDNEVIATTDADALPPGGWVERIRSQFGDDPELTVLWGAIEDRNGVPIRNLIGKFSTLTGGASGNNTAYRKSAYEEVGNAYPDVNFAEDFAAIARLATVGKAVRDEGLVMVMDMDRSRYQKKPILGAAGVVATIGHVVDGKYGDLAKGAAVGLAGTELTYEEATGTPFHHDQVGAGVYSAGSRMGSRAVSGAGIGMVAHHVMTEGLSAMPTLLEKGTEEVRR